MAEINAEILKGQRAKYGEEIVATLSQQLSWAHIIALARQRFENLEPQKGV